MKTYNWLFIVCLLLVSCTQQAKQEKIQSQLLGEWERCEKETEIPVPLRLPYTYAGIKFTKDSIESLVGFLKQDTTTPWAYQYLGHSSIYRIKDDSIFVRNLEDQKWHFKWIFLKKQNDTLWLKLNDWDTAVYRKLEYQWDSLPDFDQVIYSRTGCYGRCPVMDISLDRSGNILYLGEEYVKNTGLFQGKLDSETTKWFFHKLRKSDPTHLSDSYQASHTDDESIITTFIKNGKIVKTIHDYGRKAPNQLYWTYVFFNHLTNIKLDTVSQTSQHYNHFFHWSFETKEQSLILSKSESFYLWAELKKSKITHQDFQPLYENLLYHDLEDKNPMKIKKIKTDGQYFRFVLSNYQTVTYDLGYNFIKRNFNKTDFRKSE